MSFACEDSQCAADEQALLTRIEDYIEENDQLQADLKARDKTAKYLAHRNAYLEDRNFELVGRLRKAVRIARARAPRVVEITDHTLQDEVW